MTEGVFHSIQSLRSSFVFSSFHSCALLRLRTDIQKIRFQIVCSGQGQLRSGSVHVRSVFRSVRLGYVQWPDPAFQRSSSVRVCSVWGDSPPCSGLLLAAAAVATVVAAAATA